jgi:hypothetical protein
MRVLSVLVLMFLGVVAVAMIARGEWGFALISLVLCALISGQSLRRKRGQDPPPEESPEL